MTIVWCVIEVLFLLLFFSLPAIPEDPIPGSSSSESAPEITKKDLDNQLSRAAKDSSVTITTTITVTEQTPLLTESRPGISDIPVKVVRSDTEERETGTGWLSRLYEAMRWRVLELWKEELITLLAILFNTMFNQTAIEVRVCACVCVCV